MIQFYAPDILTNPVLPESDSQHCIRVLRMGAGDLIDVIDGRGHRLKCRILDPHHKRALVEVIESCDVPSPWRGNITIAVAPTKHLDRMEWLVEKLVEIGVDRFVPLLCRHSERKEIKTERLEKIAVSAMKQSLKATMPRIDRMTPLARFVEETSIVAPALTLSPADSSSPNVVTHPGASAPKESQPQSSARSNAPRRFVAYCDKSIERLLLAREVKPASDIVVMIGPEGDFSPEEIEMTLAAGYVPVSLGDCRLRTETAALAACQTIHVIDQLYQ